MIQRLCRLYSLNSCCNGSNTQQRRKWKNENAEQLNSPRKVVRTRKAPNHHRNIQPVSFEKPPVANFSANIFLWHTAAVEVIEAEKANMKGGSQIAGDDDSGCGNKLTAGWTG